MNVILRVYKLKVNCKLKCKKENKEEKKPIKNMQGKDRVLIRLFKGWLLKIMKHWDSRELNKNRVNKTWYWVIKRSKHFCKDNVSLKNMKIQWLQDMHKVNRIGLQICKLWKMLLKSKEKLYSKKWQKKKQWEELS